MRHAYPLKHKPPARPAPPAPDDRLQTSNYGKCVSVRRAVCVSAYVLPEREGASVSLFGNNFPEATPIMGISSFNSSLPSLYLSLIALSDCRVCQQAAKQRRHSHAIKVPLREGGGVRMIPSNQLCGGRGGSETK